MIMHEVSAIIFLTYEAMKGLLVGFMSNKVRHLGKVPSDVGNNMKRSKLHKWFWMKFCGLTKEEYYEVCVYEWLYDNNII